MLVPTERTLDRLRGRAKAEEYRAWRAELALWEDFFLALAAATPYFGKKASGGERICQQQKFVELLYRSKPYQELLRQVERFEGVLRELGADERRAFTDVSLMGKRWNVVARAMAVSRQTVYRYVWTAEEHVGKAYRKKVPETENEKV